MSNTCLNNLFPNSVLAYNNIDLIPNGFIDAVGTTALPKTKRVNGSIISEKDIVKVLPADRIYAEFWFEIQTRVTGTNLGDSGPGAFQSLGLLGLGAGAGVGGFLACQLTGDAEQVTSRWVFHVCESETRINREIILTKENITTGKIELPDYITGILGLTRKPISFVTTENPTSLTEEQKDRARKTEDSVVEQKLGKRVAPNQLTDTDMRILLGIPIEDELLSLGNNQGRVRGWGQSNNGQILAEFKNFKYSDKENLFISIVRDPRKNKYRADNEFDRDDTHCFLNGSEDDLTDKIISFKLKEESLPGDAPATATPLKEGDKVYISYVATINPIFRHAVENKTNFFLFPGPIAYQMPPLDLIKGWNFKKFKFKVTKNEKERCSIYDILNDESLYQQIEEINNSKISQSQKKSLIEDINKRIRLQDIEGQRLVESKVEKANRVPFIKGCYFADSRGILILDFSTQQLELAVARKSIRDQKWFDDFIKNLIDENSTFFDDNGEFINNSNAGSFFDDFLFDVSDHVNSVLYDNEKFGYERRLANAILKCSVFVKEDSTKGIGSPNLDFVKNKTKGSNNYDLTSVKFSSVPMQSSPKMNACNVNFTYDNGFCSKGTIRADMLLRTPIFLQKIGEKARIYVERTTASSPLKGDGAIWAGTNPTSFSTKYSVITDHKHDKAFLIYPDSNSTLKYRIFDDVSINYDLENLKNNDPQETGHTDVVINSSLKQTDLESGGYNYLLGDQPGFSSGTEVTTEETKKLINKISFSETKNMNLDFSQDLEKGMVNVIGLEENRIKKIKITYSPKTVDFLNIKERLVSFIFPVSKKVIDNVIIPYEGYFSPKSRVFEVYCPYLEMNSFFIDGEVLKHVTVSSVNVDYISEEEYESYKISTGSVSSCFDPEGNWLIFYEDEKASEGKLETNGFKNDGSHIADLTNKSRTDFTGISDDASKEISCLISPDYGKTWFDHKAVVRSAFGEFLSSPQAVPDNKTGKVHLFYILNNILMHKTIDTSLFSPEDAFLGYKRPLKIDEYTIPSYGLFHFSKDGIKLREGSSNVVVSGIESKYLQEQLRISKAIQDSKNTDFRIFYSGDLKDYINGFGGSDFFAYKDPGGQLKVLFVLDNKFYCRISSDNGKSWFDFVKDDLFIHKNNKNQELRSVTNIGFAKDFKSKQIYLTYQVDGMLFLRQFNSEVNQTNHESIKESIDNGYINSIPTFVVGKVSQELKNAIKNKENYVYFPYKDVDIFGDNFSISDTPSFGYCTKSGILRFFYKDSSDNFRAFTYKEIPILDITLSKGN